MFFLYVLQDRQEDKLYVGYTSDIERRIKEHQKDSVNTTKRYKEKKLIFYEAFLSKQDALRRERYFKSTKGKRALKLMLKDTFKERLN